MKRLFTIKEAAGYCGVGRELFLAKCSVRPKRIAEGPRGLRYDVRDLDKWIDELASTDVPRTADDWLGLFDAEDRKTENSGREGVSQQGQVVRLSPKNRASV
jgi:hypothetical protein